MLAVAIIGAGWLWSRYRNQLPGVGDCLSVGAGTSTPVSCSSVSATHKVIAVRQGTSFSVQLDCMSMGAQAFELTDGSQTLCLQAMQH